MTPAGEFPEDPGEAAGEDPLSHLLAGPTDGDRTRLRADLLARAALVRANGWESCRGIWSTGEVVGVAVVLADHAELAVLGETEQSALERWAFDLWGLQRGTADVANGCRSTREWFEDAASDLGNDDALRDLSRPAADSSTFRRTRHGRTSGSEDKGGER